jgi:hypothetical protein
MEINLCIPDDWCQGYAQTLEPLDPDELPVEDRRAKRRVSKVKYIKVKRAKKSN